MNWSENRQIFCLYQWKSLKNLTHVEFKHKLYDSHVWDQAHVVLPNQNIQI